MNAVSRGFFALRDQDVRLDPWSVSLDRGAAEASPSRLENWSYYQPVRVRATVVVELGEVFRLLGLGEDAVISLVVVWTSPGTSLRGASTPVQFEANEISAEVEIDGAQLRGELRLECQIILTHPSSDPQSPLAPTDPGSILWSSNHTVRLEGVGSRMPVLAVPFSKYHVGAGGHGMWWLQVSRIDFFANADAVLWMWLNDENSEIIRMLAEPASEAAIATQRFLKMDLCRQLVQLGLSSDEFSGTSDYPIGTLGAVIQAPMRLLDDDVESLRARWKENPFELEAVVQARLGGL